MILFYVACGALPGLLTLVFAFIAAGAAARGVHTIVHVNPEAEVNERTQLDLEIIDSFGTSVPWGDLHIHHERRMHVYIVHEDLEHIQHVHPDDFKDLTTMSTTFSMSLVFPVPGTWILHVSFVMRSNQNALGDAVSEVHEVQVTDHNANERDSSEQAQKKHVQYGLSSIMAHTAIQTMHEQTGMITLPALPDKENLQVSLDLPQGGLWKGHCHRLLLQFEGSDRMNADVHLVPFLGAGMHVFIAQHPGTEKLNRDVIHAHGLPEGMDASMSRSADDTDSDMCNMDVHSMEQSGSDVSFPPVVVMHVRFSEAGPYTLFPQVATGDEVHIARIDVVVQDIFVDVQAKDESQSLSMSFSVLRSVTEQFMLPVQQYAQPNLDAPCTTLTDAALTWFGSICLSACKVDDAKQRVSCPVPFPADGDYFVYTVGDLVTQVVDSAPTVLVYARNHIARGDLTERTNVQSSHAVRTTKAVYPQQHFVGGHIGKELGQPEEVDVQMTVNGGMTVYAGSCAFVELTYKRRLDNGSFIEIDELQTFMRSAARMLVVPPGESKAELLVAHSLKESLSRPWDFLGVSIEGETGGMLWSPTNPCLPGLQRTLSPRVTGDLGPRVGQYFRFSKSGMYTVIAQAQAGEMSIISRHNITVCDWKSSGAWSDACMWNVPPVEHDHVTIEEGMDLTLDVTPPQLSSLTVAGTLTISPELKDGVLSAGTISIHKNGALQLGSRDKPFKGTFMLNLNSSLHEFGPHAVSYLDVYGSLQLKSADIETADETVPAWTCTDIRNATFLLQGISSADVIKRGSRLGVTSSHGEEVVTVDSYSQGLVTLTKPLRVAHGNKAIVYNLSHRIRIRGSGNTAIRVWNGQPHAGGTVDAKEPAFHHHRRLHCAAHAAGVTLPRCDASGSGSPPAARTLLQSSSLARRPRSDVGYQDTNIYRSSLKQPQLAGKVELHGVEISGLGVPLGPQAQAALAMTDYACAVRWPDFRKYISLMSLSMHSLKAGCIDFHGCTGGFEIQTSLFFGSRGDGVVLRPQDVLESPPWRIGMEGSVVHVSADAGTVRSGRSHRRYPAALLVGNAAMPTGSLTHSLVLHVSDSFFINPLGPGVVWTPAVPGRLQDCEARGEAMSTSAYFATCVRKAEKHGFEVESISTNTPDTGRPDPASLLASVVAVPVDDIPIDVGSGGSTSKAAMAHLHVHVPPEAIDIAVILTEVQGSDKLWATLTWPTESSLWSDMYQLEPELTGGMPCHTEAHGCSADHNLSHHGSTWFFNDAVDGPLEPSDGQPVEFALATTGEGIYGVGLTTFPASQDIASKVKLGTFEATVAADVQRCSPGHVPVAVAPDTRAPDVVPWRSQGNMWYSQCVLPPRLSLNQPTRGFVLTGTALEYFQFYVTEGVRSLLLMVKVLYSDEPDVMLDFYATRNSLWTKHTPFDTAPETLRPLPALHKDTDASSRKPFQVTQLLEFPPWGSYYGVISQGVRISASKTEVEVTIITTEDMRAHQLLLSGNADTDTALRSTQHTVAATIVDPGNHKLPMGPNDANGTARQCFKVEVPTGVQRVKISVQPSGGASFRASHSNWSPPGNTDFGIQSSSGVLVMHAEELYGRWGTWFVCLSFESDSLPANGEVEVDLNMTQSACVGTPVCSDNGVCMQDSAGSMWCRCHPGWYGHVCEVQGSSIHGGVHVHLPDQLLLSMDTILSSVSASQIVHMELRAPVLAAAALDEEMAEVFGELFGADMCQFISVEGLESDSHHNKRDAKHAATTRYQAKISSAGDPGQTPGPPQDRPVSDSPAASNGTAKPHARRKHRAGSSGTGTRPNAEATSTSAEPTVQTGRAHQVDLLLPGAVLDVPYASAVAQLLSGSPVTHSVDVLQSDVLVTAYLLQSQYGNSSGGALIINAIANALSAQVRADVGGEPEIHLIPAAAEDATSSNHGHGEHESQSQRRLHSRSDSASSNTLSAGVIISDVTVEQRMSLEDLLVDALVVQKLRKAANNELQGSGASIINITPGLVVPSVLLAVKCTGKEKLCGNSAREWDSVVHAAAEAERLQQPDDVWVFEVTSDGLTAMSEDFESVTLHQRKGIAWRALLLWGAATLAAVVAAMAVYSSFSRTQWRQPRTTMWEGYSAVGGPAGAVGEAIAGRASPLSISDVSPLARGSARMRLTRSSSMMDYYRAMTGYGPLAPVEQPWSGVGGRRSSLMSPSLVCRVVEDDAQGMPTMRSLASGSSFDSQPLRSAPRTSTTGALLTSHFSIGNSPLVNTAPATDPEATAKPVRLPLFPLAGRRATRGSSPDLPELHASCMPTTDHLPAYKAWMKGARSQKHGDWLRGRRWSLLTRSGAASSLSEAVDLSLNSMTAMAVPAQLGHDSAPGNAPAANPAGKLSVINELPQGQSATESDEAHVMPSSVSGSFPRASRKASAMAAGVPYPHDDLDAASGGGHSGAEASSAHESRWEPDDSIGDKGPPSTDMPSCSSSQDARLRDEMGICRAANMGVSCILQARTHQWVSGMPGGDVAPQLPDECAQATGSSAAPVADSADTGQPPVFIRIRGSE